LELPEVTLGISRPSFTDEELWKFLRDHAGVTTGNPHLMRYCFQYCVHRAGFLIYRLKRELPEMVRLVGGEVVKFLEDPDRYLLNDDDAACGVVVIQQTHDDQGRVISRHSATRYRFVCDYTDAVHLLGPVIHASHIERTLQNSMHGYMARKGNNNNKRNKK
jgi:hypothetical protein